MEQRSTEWFDSRLGKLTGSMAVNVMGTPAARRRYLIEKAVEIATGEFKEIHSKYLTFGIDQEPAAVAAYTLQTGLAVEHIGMVTLDYLPRVACSPDGLVVEKTSVFVQIDKGEEEEIITRKKGVIEVKSRYDVSKHVGTIFDDKIPKEYLPQCHWNMWVTKTDFCDYVSYCPAMPPSSRLHIVRLERDEDYIYTMQEKAAGFIIELDQLVERLL